MTNPLPFCFACLFSAASALAQPAPTLSSSSHPWLTRGQAVEITLNGDVPPPESTIVLLEPEIWASVQAGPNTEPTVSLGGVPYAAGPLSGFAFSDRIVIFLDGRHAKVSRLVAGEYRFKAFPPGIVIEPASVVLPHEGPLSIRWRYE